MGQVAGGNAPDHLPMGLIQVGAINMRRRCRVCCTGGEGEGQNSEMTPAHLY